MKKILVTGATGFLGNYIVPELLRQGQEVLASSSNEARARQASWFNQVNYIPFDLANFDSSKNYYHFFANPDLMIHLAWEGLPNYRSSFHQEVNFPRHAAFLENLIKYGLEDLTVTGTCLEYGMQEGCLLEKMPARPTTPYAVAKDHLRLFLEDLPQSLPFKFKWLRLFYMYGNGQNPNSLFSQLEKALTDNAASFNMSGGEQVRDYLPAAELSALIVKIALQQKVTGIINCCSGFPITVKQLVENYLKEKNRTIDLNLGYYPYPDYEPMRFWGDTHKLNSI